MNPTPADRAPDIVHRGGCHCGRVRFEVDAPAHLHAVRCNCSLCRMTGFVHLIVPAGAFRLLSGDDALVDYRFNTGIARHRFCGTCGIESFYVPRSHPDCIDVDVRCLDPGTVAGCDIQPFDDSQRATATAAIVVVGRP